MLFLLFSITSCTTVTEENVKNIAKQIDDQWGKIDTISFHEKQTIKTKILSFEEYKSQHTIKSASGKEIDEEEKENLHIQGYEKYKQNLKEGTNSIIESDYKTVTFESDIYIKKPDKYRVDYDQSNAYKTRIATSEEAYLIDWNENKFQLSCPKQKSKVYVVEPDFEKMLNSLTKKYTLKFKGTETLNNGETFVFDKIYVEGKETDKRAGNIWLDKETYMPLKDTSDPTGQTLVTIEYTNYKINEGIDYSIFMIPKEGKIEILSCDEQPVKEEKQILSIPLSESFIVNIDGKNYQIFLKEIRISEGITLETSIESEDQVEFKEYFIELDKNKQIDINNDNVSDIEITVLKVEENQAEIEYKILEKTTSQ